MVPDPAQQFPSPYVGMGNQWVSGVDPDGRWVHIAIGAAIGGIANWAMNGARFDAKGLGYFGVGAVAGALSAGIGSGVNVSMAGGSFGAGFAGTATGVASTGFLSGAITGAATGLTSGFISGMGNSLVEGQNIGHSFNNGLKQAGKQGLNAGLFGGISGGMNAFRKDLDFWSGKSSLDLSKGFGAHGIKNLNQKITGKWVGKFEGVDMYESSKLGNGQYSGGITLPGRGIVVGSGAYSQGCNKELVHHEFGHILQARKVGLKAFYTLIGPESLISAANNGIMWHSHKKFWTETWANYLSKEYFGNMYFGSSDFPIQKLHWYHQLRLLHAQL